MTNLKGWMTNLKTDKSLIAIRMFRTAAYEVNYFQAVSFVQGSLLPLVAGNDFAIQFYGYAVGFHAERCDERA